MIAHVPDNDPIAANPQGSCCLDADARQLPEVLRSATVVFERLIRLGSSIPPLTLTAEEYHHETTGHDHPVIPAAFCTALEDYVQESLLQSMGIAPGMHWQHLVGEMRSGLTNLLHELLHAVKSPEAPSQGALSAPLPKSADFLAEGIVEYGTQLFFEDFVTALGIPNPEHILGAANHMSRPYSEQAAAVRTVIETFSQDFDTTPRTLLRQMLQFGGYPDGFTRFLERIGTKSGLSHDCTHAVLLPDIHAQLDQLIDSIRPLRHDAEESGRFIGYLLTARMQQTIAAQRKTLTARFSMN